MQNSQSSPSVALSQCLIEKLIPVVPSAAVYLAEHGSAETPVVTVLTSGNEPAVIDIAYEQAAHVIASCAPVQLRMFSIGAVRQQLKNGNLYFVRNCLLAKLLYHDEADALIPIDNATQDYFDLAVDNYRKRIRAAEKLYRKRKKIPHRNYLQEAFSLQHAAQELAKLASELAGGIPDPARPAVEDETGNQQNAYITALTEIDACNAGSRSFITHKSDVKRLGRHTKHLWREVCSMYDNAIADCRKRIEECCTEGSAAGWPQNKIVSALVESAQPETLAGLTRRMAKATGPEAIYVGESVVADPPYSMLLVLTEKELEKYSKPSYNARYMTALYESFRNRVYTLDYARQEYEAGNLFFISNWALGQAVHAKADGLDARCHAGPATEKLFELAIRNFRNDIDKINAFRDGSDFYFQKNNYPQAAFLLHQAIELLFRTAERFLVGRSKIEHRLWEHQRYVAEFAPSLGKLFDYHEEEQRRLIKLLDSAYIDSRYDSYEVSRADLEIFQVKATQMQQETERLFDAMLSLCRQKLLQYTEAQHTVQLLEPARAAVEAPAEDQLQQDSALAEALQIIKGFLTVEAIYCFGKRISSMSATSTLHAHCTVSSIQQHFDLVIIVKELKPNAVPDLIDLVKVKTNFRCSVTPLIHKEEMIAAVPDRFQYFFHNVMATGVPVYQRPGAVLPSFEKLPLRDFEKAKRYWRQRHAISDIYFECTASDKTDDGIAQMSMHHVATEQACLGLIEVFLGYRPQHYALGYLMDLCLNFTTLPAEVFPRQTAEDKKLFKMLATSISDLRHKEPDDYSYVDTSLVHDRCGKFLEMAGRLAENELDRAMNVAVREGKFKEKTDLM